MPNSLDVSRQPWVEWQREPPCAAWYPRCCRFWQQPPRPSPLSPRLENQSQLSTVSIGFRGSVQYLALSAPWKTGPQSLVITIKSQLVGTLQWVWYEWSAESNFSHKIEPLRVWEDCPSEMKNLAGLQEFYCPVFYKFIFLIYTFSFTFNSCPLWVWQYCCFRLLLLCVCVCRQRKERSIIHQPRYEGGNTKHLSAPEGRRFRMPQNKTKNLLS